MSQQLQLNATWQLQQDQIITLLHLQTRELFQNAGVVVKSTVSTTSPHCYLPLSAPRGPAACEGNWGTICGSAVITEWDLFLDGPSLCMSDFLLASVTCRCSGWNTHILLRHVSISITVRRYGRRSLSSYTPEGMWCSPKVSVTVGLWTGGSLVGLGRRPISSIAAMAKTQKKQVVASKTMQKKTQMQWVAISLCVHSDP